MLQLKTRFPDKKEASVLAEPNTPYEQLVQVMDAVRASRTLQGKKVVTAELFPNISIGDAPVRAVR
jgi:biopolymer transport protein ExbD